jgi:hypothetical protein
MKIHPVRAELFHVDRRTDRQDKLVVAFSNFVNTPEEQRYLHQYALQNLSVFLMENRKLV